MYLAQDYKLHGGFKNNICRFSFVNFMLFCYCFLFVWLISPQFVWFWILINNNNKKSEKHLKSYILIQRNIGKAYHNLNQ